MNHLYQSIFKRKSVRKFDPTPLSQETLNDIKIQIDKLKPLYPNIKVNCEITNHVRSPMKMSAPHYLVISSEKEEGYNENVGFMFQQLSLYLTSIGIGSCWIGLAKPDENEETVLPFIISMAFGKPIESPVRKASEFKRKSLSEISYGNDERLEAARLAPSGMNAQNWFFHSESRKIHVYRKKLNPLAGVFLNKTSSIDIGIALSHIAMASDSFKFSKLSSYPDKKGYIYMGTVE